MEDISAVLRDVERFLTQVLGKLGNLPDDVNKERLELSQRLQKFLNVPNKETSKKKPPAPLPVEEKFEEFDEGEYGDVLSLSPVKTYVEETYDDVVTGNIAGEETYDDVVKEQPIDGEENYDDVVSVMKQIDPEAEFGEELYDDINVPTTPNNRSLSRVSNSSAETLDTKNVAEAKKPSEITDKVYEGYLEKYRTKGLLKGFASKWQRRYCILTPLALYYYENQRDQKQKGQIILPSSDSVLRKGCPSFPDVKDGKLCFELGSNERSFLFKVAKESELTIWIKHIEAALLTDLSDEQSRIMRQKSIKMSHHDDDDVEPAADDEDLYEAVDTFQKPPPPAIAEEKVDKKETPSSSNDAPALPSRSKAPSAEPPAPVPPAEEEEFDEIDDTEDYQLPDVTAPKPGSTGKAGKEEEKPPAVVKRQPAAPSGSPTLPSRPPSSQDAPHLPPRAGAKPAPGPPTPKKTPPELPTRTTPTLTKKNLTGEPSPPHTPQEEEPIPEVQPQSKPEVTPPIKAKPKGERFDYAKVYVAMWNCDADDEDDLAFSRGNYLYIREKIPNSDWWVASLMDIPDIRVGLVPRNYIMPAYVM